MRYDIIAEVIRREAAYWMALVVCPTRELWEQTYRYYYNRVAPWPDCAVPIIIDFKKELCQ